MEAANRGARVAGGSSIGLNIKLAAEADDNKYADTVINFNYFFARKVMFVKYACGIVGMPGGFGTLDEIFEALTLVQTRKIKSLPVVLYGREYWGGLIEWIETRLVREGLISAGDLALFSVTDDPDQVTEIIKDHFDRVQLECNGEPGDGRDVL